MIQRSSGRSKEASLRGSSRLKPRIKHKLSSSGSKGAKPGEAKALPLKDSTQKRSGRIRRSKDLGGAKAPSLNKIWEDIMLDPERLNSERGE